jgi:GNAT superfamily N-acetyltransferase
MSNIEIRSYLPSDRESCRGLWRELTEWHREIYQDSSIGGSSPEDHFDRHLAKVGSDHLWVAVINSKIVGLTGLIVDEKEAEVEPLIVSKAYRNIGVGSSLIHKAISIAHDLDLRFLNVKPVARNKEAIRFFSSQGFGNIGHIQLFIDMSGNIWEKSIKLHKLQFNY